MIHFSNKATLPDENFVSVTVNEFNDESAEEFKKQIEKAHIYDQGVIPVKISSHGGIIDACIQMKSAIDRSEIPVLTYVPDRAYSCGFALLAFGTDGYRFVDPNAFTMDHQAKTGTYGKDAEVENAIEFKRRKLDSFYNLLDEACGKEEGFFKNRWEDKNNLNNYLGAEETVEIGAADEASRPTVKATATVDWKVVR